MYLGEQSEADMEEKKVKELKQNSGAGGEI